jgi:type IV pilus assembly protein PilN
MSKINLLPWREALRKERQTQFFITLSIAVAIGAGIWGLIHFYHTQLISHQQFRNQFVQQEISLLDEKIKKIQRLEKEKQRLLARMRAIEQLQGNRPLVVRLFDEMVSNLPEGVSLTEVKQAGKRITIKGVAQSNARVSSFMRKLEKSKWLAKPQLDIIQAQNAAGQRISSFTLRFVQVIPKVREEDDT